MLNQPRAAACFLVRAFPFSARSSQSRKVKMAHLSSAINPGTGKKFRDVVLGQEKRRTASDFGSDEWPALCLQ
jgi:hypothetical protein